MDLKTIKKKTPERLSEPEYFQWIDEAVTEAVFTALENEHDEMMRLFEAANELAPNKEFKEGVGAAIRIVWDRQVRLLGDRKAVL